MSDFITHANVKGPDKATLARCIEFLEWQSDADWNLANIDPYIKTLGGVGEFLNVETGRSYKGDPFPHLFRSLPFLFRRGRIHGLFSSENKNDITKEEFISVLRYIIEKGLPPKEIVGRDLIDLCTRNED